MKAKTILTGTLIFSAIAGTSAQTIESASEAVENMRIGWNLGNTLDSNSGDLNNMWIEKWSGRTPSDYETAWGQPVTKPELFDLFKEAGFNAIRVPVTWYPHMEAAFPDLVWNPEEDPIGTEIRKDWMQRVHEIVDYVVSRDMYCILNIHHDTGAANTAWLRAGEKEYAEQNERFKAVWTQIAEEFKDYDDHLLFEGYNEMLDSYSSWCFASFAAPGNYNQNVAKEAYNAINSYAQSFVDAVRATGGYNATRNLIVSTYGACCGEGSWSNHLKEPLQEMKLPDDSADGHLIFEVHSYPHLASGLNATKNSVADMMAALKQHLMPKGAPVIIGEWGSDSGDDYTLRNADMLAFAQDFVERAKSYGIATFFWMGLSDGEHRSVPEFNQKDLVDAIVKGYYGENGYGAAPLISDDNGCIQKYYDIHGRTLSRPAPGVNFVRKSDGSIEKIMHGN